MASLDALPAWRPMFGESDPLVRRSHRADMRDQVARIEFDHDLVPGFADLYVPANPGDRNRIAKRVHRHVPLHVHRALMQTVHFGNPRRQRFEMQALDREQFAGHGADMFLIGRVDLIAPLARLVVQLVPTAESAPGKKVILYKMERSLHASRTVSIAALMRHEAEAEAFSKRLHLGHGNHFRSEEHTSELQ